MRRDAIVIRKLERSRGETILGRILIKGSGLRACRSGIRQSHLLPRSPRLTERTDDVDLSPAERLSDAAVATAFLPETTLMEMKQTRVRKLISLSHECLPARLMGRSFAI